MFTIDGRDEGIALLKKTSVYLGPERYTLEHMPIDVMQGKVYNTLEHKAESWAAKLCIAISDDAP